MGHHKDCAHLIYPACPKCSSDKVHRKGFTLTTGLQRFRCKSCKYVWTPGPKGNRWTGYRATIPIARKDSVTVGAGIYLEFVGGPDELQKNLHILERRVSESNLPPCVREELLQTACLDVLTGGSTCETVELKVSQAKRNAYGRLGLGSDHPWYRTQNGQGY